MSLFSEDFYNNTINVKQDTQLPILRDYLIDLNTGHLILDEYGRCQIVEKQSAIVCQAYRKIHTPEGKYCIYSPTYGSRLRTLIGKGKQYADEFIEEFLIRALVNNWDYVNSISIISTEFNGSTYTVNFQMDTVYGIVNYDGLDIRILND